MKMKNLGSIIPILTSINPFCLKNAYTAVSMIACYF